MALRSLGAEPSVVVSDDRIWLLSAARGRGIGRAAQRALAELFFTQTTVNRVEAHTDVANVAEQHALAS